MPDPNKRVDVEDFDRRSATYENSVMQRLFFDRVQQAVLAMIPPDFQPRAALDIGCGTGRLLRKAAARWPTAQLYGVDPAEGMIAQARRVSPVAEYSVGSAEDLPLEAGSVDLALSTMSFHHWADQAAGVRQVACALRPGGYFGLADVIAPLGLSKIFPHGRQTGPAALRALFARSGINVVAQKRIVFGFILVTLGERSYPKSETKAGRGF